VSLQNLYGKAYIFNMTVLGRGQGLQKVIRIIDEIIRMELL
jgi:hypothetical protein